MIRRCSYHRKTCSKINSFSKTEQLKRNKSLIVIHGQNPVKFFILPASEKTICGKRSVDQSGFVFCFFYHRTYDVFIFISDRSEERRVGKECRSQMRSMQDKTTCSILI